MIPLSVCIIGKNEEENIDVILYEIERKIQELKWYKPQIKVCNGEWYIETSIFSNRKTVYRQSPPLWDQEGSFF